MLEENRRRFEKERDEFEERVKQEQERGKQSSKSSKFKLFWKVQKLNFSEFKHFFDYRTFEPFL